MPRGAVALRLAAYQPDGNGLSEEQSVSAEDVAAGSIGSRFSYGQISRQVLVYAVGVWVLRATSFLLVPLYTRRVDTAHYGIYELLSRTFDMLCLVLPAGMVMTLMRFYGLAAEKDKNRVASTAILWPFGLGGLAALLLWLFRSPVSALVLRDSRYGSLVALLGLWVWFELTFSISSALLRARKQAALYTLSNLGRTFLTVGLSLFFVWWRHLGLVGIMLANVIGSAIPAVLLVGYALSSLGIRFSRTDFVAFARFGAPLTVTALLVAFAGTCDRYLLNMHMGPEQVGIYAIGARLATVLNVLVTLPLGLAYSPFVFSTAKRPDAAVVFGRVLTYIAIVMGACALGLALFAPELVAVLAPGSYRAAAGLARISLVGACLYALSPQIEIGIYLSGATAWKIPAFAVMTAGSFALNVALIPRYGAMGAAFAYVGAQALYLVALYLVSQRLYSIPYEWLRVAKVSLGLAAAWVVGCGLLPGLPFSSLASRAALLVLLPAALFLLRVPDADELAHARECANRLAGLPRAILRLGTPVPPSAGR